MVDKRFLVALFGFGSLAAGCGNSPWVIRRPVIVDDDFEVRGEVSEFDGDVHIEGDLTIDGETTFGGPVEFEDEVQFEEEVVVIPPPQPPPPPPPVSPPPPPPPPSPVCGNWVIETGEQCDGVNLGGQTCIGYGFDGGVLICTAHCLINFNQCTLTPLPSLPPPPSISATILGLTRPILSDHNPAGLSTGDQVQYEVRVMVSNNSGEGLTIHYLLYDNMVSDQTFTAPISSGEVVVMFQKNLTIATPTAQDCFQVRRNGVSVSGNPVCFPITVALGL